MFARVVGFRAGAAQSGLAGGGVLSVGGSSVWWTRVVPAGAARWCDSGVAVGSGMVVVRAGQVRRSGTVGA